MTLFIFVGTISKILNRRITKKIEHQHELINLKPPQTSWDSFDLSLLSEDNVRNRERLYEEAWSD